MGFIKGALFVTTGMFRPTSKRERAQRTVASEARFQSAEMIRQTDEMIRMNQHLAANADALGHSSTSASSHIAAGVPPKSKLDKLAALGELHASGVLTDQEFAEQKALLLGPDSSE